MICATIQQATDQLVDRDEASMMAMMMDTTMVVISLSVTVLAVTWSVMYLAEGSVSKVSPTTFYQEEDEEPPKTISVEDSPTVQTTESDESNDNDSAADKNEVDAEEEEEDKTLVTGSTTRECAKIEEEPAASTEQGDAPLPKKLRRAARKMLGIRKPEKKTASTPAPEPAASSPPETFEVRLANDVFV